MTEYWFTYRSRHDPVLSGNEFGRAHRKVTDLEGLDELLQTQERTAHDDVQYRQDQSEKFPPYLIYYNFYLPRIKINWSSPIFGRQGRLGDS